VSPSAVIPLVTASLQLPEITDMFDFKTESSSGPAKDFSLVLAWSISRAYCLLSKNLIWLFLLGDLCMMTGEEGK
jgi:hypothetical protein